MANVKPIVLKTGEFQQIQVGDALVDANGLQYGSGSFAVAIISGLQNGTNRDFVLANTITGADITFLNGQLLITGSGNDYTISGTALHFYRSPPIVTDVIQVFGYTGASTTQSFSLMDDETRARLNLAILR